MTDERMKAMASVSEHVASAEKAIKEFRKYGISRKGMPSEPRAQAHSLKAARDELARAIAIMEGTVWE